MTILKQSNRRKEIVTIAARLFKENSFDRTTVRTLAAATGLKSGSLFHHFKDKEEILVAVIESGLKKSIETIEKTTQDIADADQQLFAAIYGHLTTLHNQQRDAHIVSIMDWKSLSDESKAHLIELRVRLFILGSLNWTIQWFHPEQGLSIKELAKQFYSSVTHKSVS